MYALSKCSSIVETYEYDYLGNRTAKTSNGVTTEYTTDLSSGYSQVLKATDGNTTVYYTRGFELISRREVSTASYYIYDGGLSVRALTNEAGIVTDTLVFDAFGNETTKTGSSDNPYGFQGEEQDSTGLYYLRARYMDPSTGTFTTMDTYGGSLTDPMSLHKYLFANSNPVMYSDPSGHEATLQGIVTAMTISAILSAADSGITYYLKYKDSDTAKYGKTVFGWNVATAAMNGFLKGFIIGIIGYALCALLAVRILLSVVGIILGFNRALAGMDEMDSSGGNAELGLYNFLAGIVTIGVSTWGLAKSGAEFIDKYGDGIEGFGKADEYPYHNKTTIDNSENVDKHWCRKNTVGRTPSKNSSTGLDVQERMRAEGKLRGYGDEMEFLSSKDGKWYPFSDADMSHAYDAVTWWTRVGRLYGPLSPQVKAWMKNPNIYYFEHYHHNRSAGASLARQGVTYLPPATI